MVQDAQPQPVVTQVVVQTGSTVLVVVESGAAGTSIGSTVTSGISSMRAGTTTSTSLAIQGLSSTPLLFVYINGARTHVWWWTTAGPNNSAIWNIALGSNKDAPVFSGPITSGQFTMTIAQDGSISLTQN